MDVKSAKKTAEVLRVAMADAFNDMREQVEGYPEWAEGMSDGFELAETIALRVLDTTIKGLDNCN